MIVRVRMDGESDTSQRLTTEFEWLAKKIEEAFADRDVISHPGHCVIERCQGDPDVAVFGNWKGRMTIHLDTQRLNQQLAGDRYVPPSASQGA